MAYCIQARSGASQVQLNFGNRLSAQSWALGLADLAQHNVYPSNGRGSEKLTIDLRAVGYADFIILGRLLTLIDAFASSGQPIDIYLPSSEPLDRELPYLIAADSSADSSQIANLHRIARRRRQRGNCLLFMKQAGFESALEAGSWRDGSVTIMEPIADTSNFMDPEVRPSLDVEYDESHKAPSRRRRIVPYRWLAPQPSDPTVEIHNLERELITVGLAPQDCAVIAKGVIDELVENVRDHARNSDGTRPPPLVGAMVVEPIAYINREEDFEQYLQSFIEWSGELSSPLVRILVSDSGTGFGNTVQSRVSNEQLQVPTKADRASSIINEAILRAMHSWTPSGPGQLPSRGLWKVHRIIRSYAGSLVVASGTANAGYIQDHSPSSKPITSSLPYPVPGTSVECNILTAPGRKNVLQEGELPSPTVTYITQEAAHLLCATATLNPGRGIEPKDLETIQHLLQQVDPETDGLVIAVDLPHGVPTPSETELQESIQDIFRVATTAANLVAVSVVFAGVNRQLLSLGVADLNEQASAATDASDLGLSSPVLVVAPENRHYWAGGTSTLRTILGRMSQAQGPLRVDEFSTLLDQEQLRLIRFQPALLRLVDGLLHLRLRPQDAIAALTDYFAERIPTAVSAADIPGVVSGVYLTPHLRIVSRWIRVQELLSALQCESTAGLLLASLVNDRLGYFIRSTPSPMVLRIGSASRDLTTAFSLSLTGVSKFYDHASDIQSEIAPQQLSPMPPIVICTDLISSGHSVRRALRELLALGRSPVAIATIIDAREEATAAATDDYLDYRSTRIPLIKLAKVEISQRETVNPDDATPIDPVIGAPISGPQAYAKALANQTVYIKALKRTGAARLGHISRPGDRHYSGYVDSTLLFRDYDWSREALGHILHRVKESRRSAGIDHLYGADGEASVPVVIFIPSRTRDHIRDVAQRLAGALADAKTAVKGIIRVPRAMSNGQWTFPASLFLPYDQTDLLHIVILDPAARSGKTTRELIRLASMPQVRAITAIALVNSLTDYEAIALQQITSVRAISYNSETYAHDINIPVSISFLSRTAVTATSSERCSVCALRSIYSGLSRQLPDFLVEQQQVLLTALEPRSTDYVFGNEVIDLFGINIEQSDCVSYLQWRARLRDAALNTASRADAVRTINRLRSDVIDYKAAVFSERDALIRLLTAERQWLESPPLVFQVTRSCITDLALSVIQNPPTQGIDPMLRVQAIILLVNCDVECFSRHLHEIIRQSADHRLVLAQVLLEVYALLEAPRTPRHVAEMLASSLGILEDAIQEPDFLSLAPSDHHLTHQLRYLSSVARRKVHIVPSSPKAAWVALRRHLLSVQGHKYDPYIWRLRLRLENLGRGLLPNDTQAAIEDWIACTEALSMEVLVNLMPLERILLSKRVTDQLSSEDAVRWEQVIRGNGPRLLDDMTSRLRTIFKSGHQAVDSAREAASVSADADWWDRFFFSTRADVDRAYRDAVLVSLLRQCPANVLELLDEMFDGTDHEMKFINVLDDRSILAFCSSPLLADVFAHIRMNAEQSHRLADSDQRLEISLSRTAQGALKIFILNSGSDSSVGLGSGQSLGILNSEMQNFGAELMPIDVEHPWTYGVAIKLQDWWRSE